ncbi:hypothetical protein SODALDRAFT_267623 [Sodiomyces alkalinus F11]|uniref:FAD-dependent oxidoreductase-like enzyme n=1 Tax=Sodiomyces alkalinus (strain CBS 110278 / VKM F-3762 / F11) TaxID=1314773 RepID=A0A3N2Q7K7_SODAK|nr:hypothetical protein SODALDRAFT_267623 [Sodiomyces alkalinus F11]ROT42648.1 hypothetical protein SODALDRAFT_267623 [Sodiomyces alkalinus F11]
MSEPDPVTPDSDGLAILSSQVTVPSTEVPPSPIDPNASFKTEVNDDRLSCATVVPSSLTPPPSSQVPTHVRNGALPTGFVDSQRSTLFSPPDTALSTAPANARLGWGVAAGYVPPSPPQVLEATADELRAMVQACVGEHAKLKMEAAHHKLQYNLLSLQANEDAKRAEVEHEMTRREVEALQNTECSRQARRELSAAIHTAQLECLQMKKLYEQAVQENRGLKQRLKSAKMLLVEKEDHVCNLREKLDMALTRIHENREHFQMLRSPGGLFHHALTPKQQTVSTPQQPARGNRRQTPRGSHRNARVDAGHGQERMVALLQAINQDNHSAPSTPVTASRPPPPRNISRHTRNAQSLSSLPMTPDSKPRGSHSVLLPSVDLVPQTEPPRRRAGDDFIPESPRFRRRKSRESTTSATEDNEDLARRALESVVGGSAVLSRGGPHGSRGPRRPLPNNDKDGEDDDVTMSQASQAASEMLRRDPRQSFEVASSAGSPDATPAPVEKSARLQARLLSGHSKSGAEKRKFSGGLPPPEELRPDQASPTKRIRVGGDQLEERRRLGLGIQ